MHEPEAPARLKQYFPLIEVPLETCAYFPERQAGHLFYHGLRLPAHLDYGRLLEQGFRRSGPYIYRYHCPWCTACQALRLPVHEFQPKRTQKRCLKRNTAISVNIEPLAYRDEHYRLYQAYQNHRHPDGSMSRMGPQEFFDFLYHPDVNTVMIECYLDNQLIAVAMTDVCQNCISAVYTYFDPSPELQTRSLGTFCILQQIEFARQYQLQHLYLGYWIADNQKMKYKAQFQPNQILNNIQWQYTNPRSG